MLESYFLVGGLSVISFVTSLITGAVGMGGGILLLTIMPSFLPAQSIIPIHGAVQLSSNFSRFIFGIKDLYFRPLIFFIIGSFIGSFIGLNLLKEINKLYIPIFLSIFILFIIWTPFLNLFLKIKGKYFSLGIIQTALSLYVGATGPLSSSILFKEPISNNQVIVTNAAFNTVINILKLLVYFFIGFIFTDYLFTIFLMSIFAILGSYVGTFLRSKIDNDRGRFIIKILITIMCFKNIITTIKVIV